MLRQSPEQRMALFGGPCGTQGEYPGEVSSMASHWMLGNDEEPQHVRFAISEAIEAIEVYANESGIGAEALEALEAADEFLGAVFES